MFKLVTMALLLILAYGIGLVMLQLKKAPLMDDEILSSPYNEVDKKMCGNKHKIVSENYEKKAGCHNRLWLIR